MRLKLKHCLPELWSTIIYIVILMLQYDHVNGTSCYLNDPELLHLRDEFIENLFNTTYLNFTTAVNRTLANLTSNQYSLTDCLEKIFLVPYTYTIWNVKDGDLFTVDWKNTTADNQKHTDIDLAGYIFANYVNPLYARLLDVANTYSYSLGIIRTLYPLFEYSVLKLNGTPGELSSDCYSENIYLINVTTSFVDTSVLMPTNDQSDTLPYGELFDTLNKRFGEFFRLDTTQFRNRFVRSTVYNFTPSTEERNGSVVMEFYFLNSADPAEINEFLLRQSDYITGYFLSTKYSYLKSSSMYTGVIMMYNARIIAALNRTVTTTLTPSTTTSWNTTATSPYVTFTTSQSVTTTFASTIAPKILPISILNANLEPSPVDVTTQDYTSGIKDTIFSTVAPMESSTFIFPAAANTDVTSNPQNTTTSIYNISSVTVSNVNLYNQTKGTTSISNVSTTSSSVTNATSFQSTTTPNFKTASISISEHLTSIKLENITFPSFTALYNTTTGGNVTTVPMVSQSVSWNATISVPVVTSSTALVTTILKNETALLNSTSTLMVNSTNTLAANKSSSTNFTTTTNTNMTARSGNFTTLMSNTTSSTTTMTKVTLNNQTNIVTSSSNLSTTLNVDSTQKNMTTTIPLVTITTRNMMMNGTATITPTVSASVGSNTTTTGPNVTLTTTTGPNATLTTSKDATTNFVSTAILDLKSSPVSSLNASSDLKLVDITTATYNTSINGTVATTTVSPSVSLNTTTNRTTATSSSAWATTDFRNETKPVNSTSTVIVNNTSTIAIKDSSTVNFSTITNSDMSSSFRNITLINSPTIVTSTALNVTLSSKINATTINFTGTTPPFNASMTSTSVTSNLQTIQTNNTNSTTAHPDLNLPVDLTSPVSASNTTSTAKLDYIANSPNSTTTINSKIPITTTTLNFTQDNETNFIATVSNITTTPNVTLSPKFNETTNVTTISKPAEMTTLGAASNVTTVRTNTSLTLTTTRSAGFASVTNQTSTPPKNGTQTPTVNVTTNSLISTPKPSNVTVSTLKNTSNSTTLQANRTLNASTTIPPKLDTITKNSSATTAVFKYNYPYPINATTKPANTTMFNNMFTLKTNGTTPSPIWIKPSNVSTNTVRVESNSTTVRTNGSIIFGVLTTRRINETRLLTSTARPIVQNVTTLTPNFATLKPNVTTTTGAIQFTKTNETTRPFVSTIRPLVNMTTLKIAINQTTIRTNESSIAKITLPPNFNLALFNVTSVNRTHTPNMTTTRNPELVNDFKDFPPGDVMNTGNRTTRISQNTTWTIATMKTTTTIRPGNWSEGKYPFYNNSYGGVYNSFFNPNVTIASNKNETFTTRLGTHVHTTTKPSTNFTTASTFARTNATISTRAFTSISSTLSAVSNLSSSATFRTSTQFTNVTGTYRTNTAVGSTATRSRTSSTGSTRTTSSTTTPNWGWNIFNQINYTNINISTTTVKFTTPRPTTSLVSKFETRTVPTNLTTFDPDPFFKPVAPVIRKKYNDEVLLTKISAMPSLTERGYFYTIAIPCGICLVLFSMCCMFCLNIDCIPPEKKKPEYPWN